MASEISVACTTAVNFPDASCHFAQLLLRDSNLSVGVDFYAIAAEQCEL